MRKGSLLLACVVAILTIGSVAGCGSDSASSHGLVMGATSDPTTAVMATIYAGALRHAGAEVSHQTTTATDTQLLAAMDQTRVDLFPAYTGVLLTTLAPELDPITADDVYNDLNRSLPQGVSVGDPTPVAATPQVFVATALADRLGVGDLAGCSRLPAGLPLVVVAEPSGLTEPTAATLRVLRTAGCAARHVERVGDAAAAVQRVADGQALGLFSGLAVSGAVPSALMGQVRALDPAAVPTADAATTSTSGVGEPDLRAQNLVPVYRTAALTGDQVKAVNKIAGEITTADLAVLAQQVRRGASPGELATDWLAEHGM